MEAKLIKIGGKRALELPRPVFLHCKSTVEAAWALRSLEAYEDFCDQDAPDVARLRPGNFGVSMGYDFHVREEAVHLIEINTNAAGIAALKEDESIQQHVVEMFQAEYKAFNPGGTLKVIAIVDENPPEQFFYPEFLLYQAWLRKAGYTVFICDPGELSLNPQGELTYQDTRVDMVYLRLTDFYLQAPTSEKIKHAYVHKTVCVSPSPREFHLLATKKRFVQLRDENFLTRMGLSPMVAHTLASVIPETVILQDKPLAFWQQNRKNYVFKLIDKFGSRGVYPGSTLSRVKVGKLYEESRIAQALVPPGEVMDTDTGVPLKFDIRFLVYRQNILATVARVYEGMLTNFRSPRSGVIPVNFC